MLRVITHPPHMRNAWATRPLEVCWDGWPIFIPTCSGGLYNCATIFPATLPCVMAMPMELPADGVAYELP